jgi:hypothetical protein
MPEGDSLKWGSFGFGLWGTVTPYFSKQKPDSRRAFLRDPAQRLVAIHACAHLTRRIPDSPVTPFPRPLTRPFPYTYPTRPPPFPAPPPLPLGRTMPRSPDSGQLDLSDVFLKVQQELLAQMAVGGLFERLSLIERNQPQLKTTEGKTGTEWLRIHLNRGDGTRQGQTSIIEQVNA